MASGAYAVQPVANEPPGAKNDAVRRGSSGEITVMRQGNPIPLSSMGRIGAQTVKQVMIQLIRQDERGSIYEEYKDRVGTIVTGTIARFEGPAMVVNLGRVEGIMPRSEQIPGEAHEVGERVQALITEVRDTPSASAASASLMSS